MNRHPLRANKSPIKLLAVAAVVAAAAVFAPGSSSASDSSQGSWERLRTEDGISVFRKEIPGSKFVAFRGEGDVDAPILSVASVLVDVPHEKDWIDSVVEARVLHQVTETEYVMYSHVGTPPTMSDRDFVTDVSLTLNPPQKSLTVQMHSITDPAAPTTSYVRAELKDSVFVLSSVDHGRKTHVVAEIHCDPKGGVAAWMVNWFQKNWGYNTVASMRRQVQRTGGKMDPRLTTMLKEKGFFD
jgi:hypothetical protein